LAKLHVLVVGATGQQGSAVVRALLQGGHNVRAMTRNLAHPVADSLRLRGARLAWADLNDERRLGEAMNGVDAVFALTTPRDHGTAMETRQGLRLAELAQQKQVSHFVYSSLVGASALTGVPHFDSKHEVELFLKALGVPHTVISPAFFMDNLVSPSWLRHLQQGTLSLPLSSSRKLQQLAIADVGRFVRVVMEQRDRFVGQRVSIASDELTPIEMAATLARIIGQRVQHVAPDPAQLRARSAALAAMYEWLDRNGGNADVTALRREFPEVNWHTLDGWAKRQDWTILSKPATA
jgi:uncharacterized protein YbjT (DUF2867 family)